MITRDVSKWNLEKLGPQMYEVLGQGVVVLTQGRNKWAIVDMYTLNTLSPQFPTRHAALSYWFDDVPF